MSLCIPGMFRSEVSISFLCWKAWGCGVWRNAVLGLALVQQSSAFCCCESLTWFGDSFLSRNCPIMAARLIFSSQLATTPKITQGRWKNIFESFTGDFPGIFVVGFSHRILVSQQNGVPSESSGLPPVITHNLKIFKKIFLKKVFVSIYFDLSAFAFHKWCQKLTQSNSFTYIDITLQ